MSDRNLSAFLWSVADLLRGDYKQSDYGKIILPFPARQPPQQSQCRPRRRPGQRLQRFAETRRVVHGSGEWETARWKQTGVGEQTRIRSGKNGSE